MPPVSVVMPSFNQGRFIERAIQSVLSQDCGPLELLVFDGGSADETVSVLERYADVLRWVSEPDRGQAHAVNKGLRAGSGDVIGWLNSDDLYRPAAVATACEYLEAHPDVDVVYGEADYIDIDDRVLGRYYTEAWNPARLRETNILCQPAVFFRRRVVDRFGLLDEGLKYCLDYEYWLRLAFGGARFAYLSQVLAASRLHPETKTVGQRLPMHPEINRMLRTYYGRVPERWLLAHAHTLLELGSGPDPRHSLRYRAAAVRLALGLSWEWNRSISARLAATVVRMLVGGLLQAPVNLDRRPPAGRRARPRAVAHRHRPSA
jgi:glycosyltransferase involved in cell wall biosynthesis